MPSRNELGSLRQQEFSGEKVGESPLEFLSEEQFGTLIQKLMEGGANRSEHFLRQFDFSEEDREKVKEVVENGDAEFLKILFVEKIANEKKTIKDFIEKGEFDKEIVIAQNKIIDFFDKAGMAIPEDFSFEKFQFLGPYSSFLINAVGSGIQISFGRYYETLDMPVVFIGPKDFAGINNFLAQTDQARVGEENVGQEPPDKNPADFLRRLLDTYVHENLHAMSAKHIETAGEQNVFSGKNTIRHTIGFQSNMKTHKESTILNRLNEGATEYFTRLILGHDDSLLEMSGYEAEVSVASNLIRFLSGKEVEEDDKKTDYNPDSESLKRFLHQYIIPEGILSLGREMEKNIGPHALGILETNFHNFTRFLCALQAHRAGGKMIRPVFFQDGDNFINGERLPGRIANFRSEIEKLYPFVNYDIDDFVKKNREYMQTVKNGKTCVQDNIT